MTCGNNVMCAIVTWEDPQGTSAFTPAGKDLTSFFMFVVVFMGIQMTLTRPHPPLTMEMIP